MTTSEDVIDEIRESRKRMSEECDHDLAKLIAYLKHYEEKNKLLVNIYRNNDTSQKK